MTSSAPVRRIASIIDVVASARGGISLARISEVTDIPISTAYRTVQILMNVGYITIDPGSKEYSLGDRLKRVFALSIGTDSLREIAQPVIGQLSERFSETAFVAKLSFAGPELIDYHFPTTGPRTLVHPGFNFPMHATAVGKAIYAFQADDVIEAQLGAKLTKFRSSTVTSRRAVRKMLKQVQDNGYAMNDAELDPGVFAIAVPIVSDSFGVIGAMALCGIKDRMLGNQSVEEIVGALKSGAAEIAHLYNPGTPNDP